MRPMGPPMMISSVMPEPSWLVLSGLKKDLWTKAIGFESLRDLCTLREHKPARARFDAGASKAVRPTALMTPALLPEVVLYGTVEGNN